MISIDIFQKHSLRILVWNIFYHYRGSDIFTFCDFMQINFKVNFFVIWWRKIEFRKHILFFDNCQKRLWTQIILKIILVTLTYRRRWPDFVRSCGFSAEIWVLVFEILLFDNIWTAKFVRFYLESVIRVISFEISLHSIQPYRFFSNLSCIFQAFMRVAPP